MSNLHNSAVLDSAHLGDIRGAFGTIRRADTGPRNGWIAHLKTLLAILGPGLIVMVGDNDAGAFSIYAQTGQNHGTALLWTLALLIPVLYVNQEMVLRLGAAPSVGHARLILERFSKYHRTAARVGERCVRIGSPAANFRVKPRIISIAPNSTRGAYYHWRL